MPDPVITNRAPAAQSIGGTLSPVRFSVRDSGLGVLKNSLYCHIGEGTCLYNGDKLPEDYETTKFLLQALSGNPTNLAARSIVSGALKLEKLLAGTPERATYFFGGPEAPADPSEPLMVEFTLKLAQADVGNIQPDNFTGVMAGLLINDSGLTVRFFTTGATRRIEIWDAGLATLAPPSPSYVAVYDWDQSASHTYKLLWQPQLNLVRLYVSTGSELQGDLLLIDGLVSDFPVVPVGERRLNQPWVFFGHGYPAPTSTSYWSSVYFYNRAYTPIVDGLGRGDYKGFVDTDHIVKYLIDDRPRDSERPWYILPDSYDSISGDEYIEVKKLVLRKTDPLSSQGFFRIEPRLALTDSVFDFKVSGESLVQASDSVSTGMELFVDTGSRIIRFALLQSSGMQYIGLLKTGSLPKELTSYLSDQRGWVNDGFYRIIIKGSNVYLRQLISGSEEDFIFGASLASFPATSITGYPSVGFLHNGLVGENSASMRLGLVRYMTNARILEGVTTIAPPWLTQNTSAITQPLNDIVMDNSTGVITSVYRLESLSLSKGVAAEFRLKIGSYTYKDQLNPINSLTGVGFSIDDATYRLMLVFADAGPVLGKIAFVVSDLYENGDVEAVLYSIISGQASAASLYTKIDWSQYHIYRFERDSVGTLRLFIDEIEKAFITVPSIHYLNTEGAGQFKIGNLLAGYKNTSYWTHLRYSISMGIDVSVTRTLPAGDSRFATSVNSIVEASSQV
jgi:hypothetical protein